MNIPVFFSPMRQVHPSAASFSDAEELFALCRLEATQCCQRVASRLDGLSADEAATRLKRYGPNLVTRERKPTIAEELWNRAKNPLNALLLTLATVSYFLNDINLCNDAVHLRLLD